MSRERVSLTLPGTGRITVPMARILRILRRGDGWDKHGQTLEALERRRLIGSVEPRCFTHTGYRMAWLLGDAPTPYEAWRNCVGCGRELPPELFAWDTYDYAADTGVDVLCIRCAMERTA
jgi:hypothetical protein